MPHARFPMPPPRTERVALRAGPLDASMQCVLLAAGASRRGLTFPRAVLHACASRFDAAPCFLDHATPQDGQRPGGRSVRDLVGLFADIVWDPARGAVMGRLVLAREADGVRELAELFAQHPERFGLSADLTVTRHGATVTAIERVHSVDIVVNPAAGGRILVSPPNPFDDGDPGGASGSARAPSSSDHPPSPRKGVATMTTTLSSPATERVVTAAPAAEEPQLADTAAEAPAPDAVGDAATPADLTAVLAREVLAARLASSHLPESLQRLALERLGGAADGSGGDQPSATAERLRAALSTVDHLQEAWAQALSGASVRRLGARDRATTRGSLERISLAFERLMGLPESAEHRDVPRLTGIREMYDLLTGDWERHGIYRGDRVTLANATTSTMAEVVRNTLNKVMLRAFESRPQWWKPIAHEDDFPTMNTVRWITVGGIGDLSTVTEGNAYTETTWDDAAETSSFTKVGNYIGLTLEMIDRDDVGAVRALPRRLGHAANRTLAKAVADLFTTNANLADGNPLFDATHSNLGSSALSATSWDTAIQAMFKQAEYHSSKRLGVRPKFCLVPIELEKTALTVFTSDGEPGTANNDANVRRYSAGVLTVPEWTDADNWYAAADPGELEGVCIGYRFGRAPELYLAGDELVGSMFTNDEMRIKVRFIYALGVGDYRALYASLLS